MEVALGLPPDLHSYAIVPISYPMGRFGPARPVPLAEVVYEDQWGQPYRDHQGSNTMPAPQLPAFDPHDVPESNATSYPEPHRAANLHRYNRRLGDHVGLQNYGVVMTRIVPGGQSSHRHAHSRQDEFIYVLEGEVTLETNSGQQILSAGMCAGFPAGTGDGHRFVNHSSADTVLLVVGDRTANDEVSYPDIDMHLQPLPDGTRRFTRKDGTPY